MIVRDLFQNVAEERIIARAVYEDYRKPQEIDEWISKYYSQLMKLKSSKVRKSDMMFFLMGVRYPDDLFAYGDVSGITYEDVKHGVDRLYSIELLNYRQYASLYVPDYTVKCFGEEVVATEALREYGWNGYDKAIVCPEDVRRKVIQAMSDMTHEMFPSDSLYYDRCRKQFRKVYEGKEVPQWEAEEMRNDYPLKFIIW